MPVDPAAATTFLFVPAARPDRFDKAVAAGADVVVLDLEDAVAPEGKDEARTAVAGWLDAGGSALVRINGADTPWFADDLAMARERGVAVMLPKAAPPWPEALTDAGQSVVALVETAVGLLAAAETARRPEVVRLAFGSVDLAAELGLDHTDVDALSHARSVLAVASRAAGLPGPIDGVTTAVRDEELLRADCAHALSRGFTARLCIHPSQVAPTAAALLPDEDTVRWARAVVEAAAGGAVAVLDGAMVDKPVVDRARAILARIGEPDPAQGL
ncbi:HpcH/HpaI aldolase/citrate lyase family protein [Actinomycetospora termitidis]|uniref:CoA ester lyase n=1 Tax=Actinomycetospora termitidis TaxID=3053470 RepID=A0ABT7MEM1_9PSEU|nr:CoA ester lyase [Actinomycetospora sp. Odt1-22]MDL5159112.1 CoA ester lyase [Actinomycetospora sp. Odt1-22]